MGALTHSLAFFRHGRWKIIPAITMLALTQLAVNAHWNTETGFFLAGLGAVGIALAAAGEASIGAEFKAVNMAAVSFSVFLTICILKISCSFLL